MGFAELERAFNYRCVKRDNFFCPGIHSGFFTKWMPVVRLTKRDKTSPLPDALFCASVLDGHAGDEDEDIVEPARQSHDFGNPVSKDICA